MPRIPQSIIKCVFYLYRSHEDAKAGRDPGGTGFIVKYDHPYNAPKHYYGVTNWHVALDDGCSVVRLNKKDGGTDILDFGPEDWHFIPGKYDVAAVPLALDENIHDVSSSSVAYSFVRARGHDEPAIGDDVFMIGMFFDNNGATENVPSARFGNISMLPNDKTRIEQSNEYKDASYVLDMHSRTGFSGSPVWVYRTFANDLNDWFGHEFSEIELQSMPNYQPTGPSWATANRRQSFRGKLKTNAYLKLLGIHWGQFPEEWEIKEGGKDRSEAKRKGLISDGAYIKGMSGMTCVIPAWEILEVLDMPSLKGPRDAINDAHFSSKAARAD
jgi:hypothetical protein